MRPQIRIGYNASSIWVEVGNKRLRGDIEDFSFLDALKESYEQLGYEVELEECY